MFDPPTNLELNSLGVLVCEAGIGHRQDRRTNALVRRDHGVGQVTCKCADPASMRRVRSKKGDLKRTGTVRLMVAFS